MSAKIHVLVDLEAMIGIKPDTAKTQEFVRNVLDSMDTRYGSLTIQDGKPEVGSYHISVHGCQTETRAWAIKEVVHRQIQCCLAAWEE